MNKDIEILLVEDNPTDAEMTIHVLRKNNLANKLLHVKDGAEALDFIFAEGVYTDRQVEQKPRLILMDLKMPKVNGIEVLENIKADERTKKIPVVILTSSKEDPDISKCLCGQTGIIRQLSKSDNTIRFILDGSKSTTCLT
jgi:two-component system response regulator